MNEMAPSVPLSYYDDKPCTDCEHLGKDHDENGICLRRFCGCTCPAYHFHEVCGR